MRLFLGVCALLALPFAFWSGVASAAAADEPSATSLIFDHKHLANVEQGSEVEYKFNRSVSDAKLLGEPFSDEINIKIVATKPTGEKDVELQIYTGERARELQKIPDLTINPIFIVYLQQAVSSFSNLSGGKHSYLKRVFSMALKDKATVSRRGTHGIDKLDGQGCRTARQRLSDVCACRLCVCLYAGQWSDAHSAREVFVFDRRDRCDPALQGV
ncbi:MAG: hypothetical protein ACTSSR_08660 [Alphaproteobacteria bacterium]